MRKNRKKDTPLLLPYRTSPSRLCWIFMFVRRIILPYPLPWVTTLQHPSLWVFHVSEYFSDSSNENGTFLDLVPRFPISLKPFPGILMAGQSGGAASRGRGKLERRKVTPWPASRGGAMLFFRFSFTRNIVDQVVEKKLHFHACMCTCTMQYVADIIILTLSTSNVTSLESLQCNTGRSRRFAFFLLYVSAPTSFSWKA